MDAGQTQGEARTAAGGPGRRVGVTAFRSALLAALAAWGIFGWWQVRSARRAGGGLAAGIEASWPLGASPAEGTRHRLLAAARRMEAGDFRGAAAELGDVRPPAGEARRRAERFFGKAKALRERLLDCTESARGLEAEGVDVRAVRDALARALAAAARNDPGQVTLHLEAAEQLVRNRAWAAAGAAPADAGAGLAGLLERMEPAYRLSEELATEGHEAVKKLLVRASQLAGAGQPRPAAALVGLAAQLLGLDAEPPGPDGVPAWFEDPATEARPPVPSDPASVQASVELAEAMTASQSAAEPVALLVRRARRHLDGDRPEEAGWWAHVALNALGMTDQDIRAASQASEAEADR